MSNDFLDQYLDSKLGGGTKPQGSVTEQQLRDAGARFTAGFAYLGSEVYERKADGSYDPSRYTAPTTVNVQAPRPLNDPKGQLSLQQLLELGGTQRGAVVEVPAPGGYIDRYVRNDYFPDAYDFTTSFKRTDPASGTEDADLIYKDLKDGSRLYYRKSDGMHMYTLKFTANGVQKIPGPGMTSAGTQTATSTPGAQVSGQVAPTGGASTAGRNQQWSTINGQRVEGFSGQLPEWEDSAAPGDPYGKTLMERGYDPNIGPGYTIQGYDPRNPDATQKYIPAAEGGASTFYGTMGTSVGDRRVIDSVTPRYSRKSGQVEGGSEQDIEWAKNYLAASEQRRNSILSGDADFLRYMNPDEVTRIQATMAMANGGSIMTRDPIAMVRAKNFPKLPPDTVAVAGEGRAPGGGFMPERIDVTPMRSLPSQAAPQAQANAFGQQGQRMMNDPIAQRRRPMMMATGGDILAGSGTQHRRDPITGDLPDEDDAASIPPPATEFTNWAPPPVGRTDPGALEPDRDYRPFPDATVPGVPSSSPLPSTPPAPIDPMQDAIRRAYEARQRAKMAYRYHQAGLPSPYPVQLSDLPPGLFWEDDLAATLPPDHPSNQPPPGTTPPGTQPPSASIPPRQGGESTGAYLDRLVQMGVFPTDSAAGQWYQQQRSSPAIGDTPIPNDPLAFLAAKLFGDRRAA